MLSSPNGGIGKRYNAVSLRRDILRNIFSSRRIGAKLSKYKVVGTFSRVQIPSWGLVS